MHQGQQWIWARFSALAKPGCLGGDGPDNRQKEICLRTKTLQYSP